MIDDDGLTTPLIINLTLVFDAIALKLLITILAYYAAEPKYKVQFIEFPSYGTIFCMP